MANSGSKDPNDPNQPGKAPKPPSVATETSEQTSAEQSKREAVMDAYRNLLAIEDSVRHLREDLSVAEEESVESAGAAAVSSRWEPVVRDTTGKDFFELLDMRKVGMGIRRRLWFILTLAVIFSAAGSAISAFFLTGQRAEAMLLFENQAPTPDPLGMMPKPVTMETVAEMVKIPRNMEAVRAAIGSDMNADEIANSVDVATRRSSNLIRIRATTSNPNLSKEIANALAEVAVADSRKRYEDAANRAYEFLKEEEEVARKRLDVLNREIAKFKSQERLVELDLDNRAVVSQSSDLATAAKNAALEYEGLLAQYQNLEREIANLPDTIVSYEYEDSPLKGRITNREMALLEARTRYGPDNPKVLILEEELRQLRSALSDQAFDESRQRIYENNFSKEQLKIELMRMKGQLNAAKQRKETLAARIQQQDVAVEGVPQIQLEYGKLVQAASVANAVHQELIDNLRKVEAQMGADRSDVGVFQLSNSAWQYKSFFARFLPTLGFLLGGALALMFVLSLELRDKRLRTNRQVRRSYNATHLLSVPEISGLNLRNAEDRTLFYVRNLTERVARLISNQKVQTMLFTSSRSGEGKSLLGYHFACYHQRIGLKVAYVNFDHRENSFIRRGPKPRRRIEEALKSGDINLEELVAKGERVDVLYCGFHPGMKELVKSDKMQALWDKLKEEYELIVVEAPGIIEDDYAVNLAQQCDVNFFVIGSNKASKPYVDASLEELEERRIRPTGLILNRMKRSYVEDPRIHVQRRKQSWWGRWFGGAPLKGRSREDRD